MTIRSGRPIKCPGEIVPFSLLCEVYEACKPYEACEMCALHLQSRVYGWQGLFRDLRIEGRHCQHVLNGLQYNPVPFSNGGAARKPFMGCALNKPILTILDASNELIVHEAMKQGVSLPQEQHGRDIALWDLMRRIGKSTITHCRYGSHYAIIDCTHSRSHHSIILRCPYHSNESVSHCASLLALQQVAQ